MKTKSWAKFIKEVVPSSSDRELLKIFIRTALSGGGTSKLLYLGGNGCNGKNTLISIISKLFDSCDISSEQIEDLIKINFDKSMSCIDSKKINFSIGFDVEIREALSKSYIFKKLVAGERIMYRLPYKDPLCTTSIPNLVACGNITDASFKLWNRILFIDMPKVITEDEVIPNLSDILLENKQNVLDWFMG